MDKAFLSIKGVHLSGQRSNLIFFFRQKHEKRLLRHFIPRNDWKIASLLDLSLRAERSNLFKFSSWNKLIKYGKKCDKLRL